MPWLRHRALTIAAVPGDEVEVIVLDWDGGDALTNCLHSIDTQSRRPSRILIVDNGSRLPVYQRLPQSLLTTPYAILRNETNLGVTAGINRAMKEVKAPFVAFVHNDVVLLENWIEKLVPAVGGEGKIAGVQSIINRDKVTVDNAGIALENGVFRPIGHGKKIGNMRQVATPWAISTTAALFRTNALREVAMSGNVFRHDLFAYFEDIELCARLKAKGWKFKLVPEALAIHRRTPNAARLGTAGFRMQIRNRYIVAKAHKGAGNVSAFLNEDIQFALRDFFRGRFSHAFARLGAVSEGLRRRR